MEVLLNRNFDIAENIILSNVFKIILIHPLYMSECIFISHHCSFKVFHCQLSCSRAINNILNICTIYIKFRCPCNQICFLLQNESKTLQICILFLFYFTTFSIYYINSYAHFVCLTICSYFMEFQLLTLLPKRSSFIWISIVIVSRTTKCILELFSVIMAIEDIPNIFLMDLQKIC